MSKFAKVLLIILYFIPTIFLVLAVLDKLLLINPTAQTVSEIKTETVLETPSNELTLMVTGDIMLGRTVMTKSIEEMSWEYPVTYVAERLSRSDITFSNLENPIIADCPIHTSGFTFCSPPESLGTLTKSGVNIVTIANNHTLNYGREGLSETKFHLKNNEILSTGTGEIEVIEIKGYKLGFIGLDLVTNEFESEMISFIKESKDKADFLILGVHWGAEYQPKGGLMQQKWANEFVKAGVDLIIGHHPHWVQDAECIDKATQESLSHLEREVLLKPGILMESCPDNSVRVYYSLGNFIFDQMWSEETKKGLAVEITIKDGVISKEEMLPVYMNNWAQPEFVINNEN